MGIPRSELSKRRETSQNAAPFLFFPPFQMRSVSRFARIAFALFGPKTKRIASAMFDFPDPFGPVTVVYPGRNGTRTLPANDLKFSIWISFRNKVSPPEKVRTERLKCPSHRSPSDCPTFVGRTAKRHGLYKKVAGEQGRFDKQVPSLRTPVVPQGCWARYHHGVRATGSRRRCLRANVRGCHR